MLQLHPNPSNSSQAQHPMFNSSQPQPNAQNQQMQSPPQQPPQPPPIISQLSSQRISALSLLQHREIVHFLKLANEKALMLLVPYRSSHSSTTRDAPLLPIITCLSTSLALTVIVSFEMSLILSKFPDQPSSRKQVWYQCVLPHLPHNDHTGFSITAQPWIS